jgi:2',3'-cyclic-nucleotide 2'-phosphodiesterase (5'-nucleotidase family)
MERSNREIAVLQLDAGHMFSDQVTQSGFSDQTRTRNEWILRGFELLDPGALNVSHRDVGYLATLMADTAHAAASKRFPVLDRFVSANVVPIDTAVRPFAPFVVREVASKRIGERPLRIGIIGLTEIPSSLGGPRAKVDIGGYTLVDPFAAAAKLVPQLRERVDLVVILAYLDRESAKRLGASVPGIDLILAARAAPSVGRVDEAGDAIVAFASHETKSLTEMRLYKSEGAKAGTVAGFIQRSVPLDSIITDDPAAFRLAAEARAAIAAAGMTGGASAAKP